MPATGATCPGITLQLLHAHPDLGSKVRDHRRRDVRLVIGKAAMLMPKRELDGKPSLPASSRSESNAKSSGVVTSIRQARSPTMPLHHAPPPFPP